MTLRKENQRRIYLKEQSLKILKDEYNSKIKRLKAEITQLKRNLRSKDAERN